MGLLDPLNAIIEWWREFVVHWGWRTGNGAWQFWSWLVKVERIKGYRLAASNPPACKEDPWISIDGVEDVGHPRILVINPPIIREKLRISPSGTGTAGASPHPQGSRRDSPRSEGNLAAANGVPQGTLTETSSTLATENGRDSNGVLNTQSTVDGPQLEVDAERGSCSRESDCTSHLTAAIAQSRITCFRFSLDAARLVLALADGRVQAFSLERGQCLLCQYSHGMQVADCCFVQDHGSSDMVLAIDTAGNFMTFSTAATEASNSARRPLSLKQKLRAKFATKFEIRRPTFSEDGTKLLCPVRVVQHNFAGIRFFVMDTAKIGSSKFAFSHKVQLSISNKRSEFCAGHSSEDDAYDVEECSLSPNGRALIASVRRKAPSRDIMILWPDYKKCRKARYRLAGFRFCWSPDSALLATWESPVGDLGLREKGRCYVYEVAVQEQQGRSWIGNIARKHQDTRNRLKCWHDGMTTSTLGKDVVVDWCGFLSAELVVTCSTQDGVAITVWDALRGEVLYENLLTATIRDEDHKLRSLLHRRQDAMDSTTHQGQHQMQLSPGSGFNPLAVSQERRWLVFCCPHLQEVYVWDAEMGTQLATFAIPPAHLAALGNGSVSVVSSKYGNKFALLGAERMLAVCLNASKVWQEDDALAGIEQYLDSSDPVALNCPDYRGMSTLLQCVNKGHEFTRKSGKMISKLMDRTIVRALERNTKIQFCHPPSLLGSRNAGDVLYLAVKRRCPDMIQVIWRNLMAQATTDYALSDILRDSLVKLAKVYPDQFISIVTNRNFLRVVGEPFPFREGAFQHHACAIGNCGFLVMTDDRLLTCPQRPDEKFLCDLWEDRVPGSQGNYLLARPYVIPVKDIAQMGNRGLIRKMLLQGLHHRMFGTKPVKIVIAYKWRTYAMKLWIEEFLHYTLLLVCFTLYALVLSGTTLFNAPSAEPVLLVLSAAMAATNLVREFEQLITYCRDAGFRGLRFWVSSYWNLVEMASYVLLIVVIPFMVLTAKADDENGSVWLSNVMAVEVILVWWRMLYYAQSFERTGPMVIMILEIIRDIRFFLFLGFSVLFGFGLAFYLVYRHAREGEIEDSSDAEAVGAQFGTFGRSLLTMFSMMLGGFDVDVLHAAPRPWLAILLFLFYMMGMMVVLLNLLIAIMNHSFGEIKKKEETKFLRARAEAIDDVESMLSNWRRDREAKAIKRYLHVLIPQTGCGDFKTLEIDESPSSQLRGGDGVPSPRPRTNAPARHASQ